MGRTETYFEREGLTERVARRDVRDIGAETSELGRRKGAVKSAQEGFDQAMEEGSENMSTFTKALKEATDALDKQQKLVDEMNRQGVTGPGGGAGKLRTLSTAMGAAATIANTASTLAVDYQIEQTQQRTTFANMANRQYEDVDKLLGGDMSALVRLTKGDAFSKAFSDRMRARTVGLKGAEATAGLIDVGTSTGAAVLEARTMDAGGSAQMLNNAARQGQYSALLGGRVMMGIEQGGKAAMAWGGGQGLSEAMTRIGTDALQTYYDVNRQSFDLGTGLGGARSGFMGGMTSAENMKRFRDAGLTPQQALQIAGAAVPNVGVTENYADLATRAGRAQQLGIMGVSDYIGATGQLANVGGGSADLESIMENAVTAGMENAKNINQMVQATTALASAGAAMGISTTAASGDILSASVQSIRAFGTNENIATTAAMASLQAAGTAGAQKGTFADLRLRAKMANLGIQDYDLDTEMQLRNLDQTMMKEVMGGSAEGRRFMRRSGLATQFGYDVKTGKFKNKAAEAQFRGAQEALTEKEVIEEMGTMASLQNMDIVKDIVDLRQGRKTTDEISNRSLKRYNAMTGRLAGNINYGGAKGTPIDEIEQSEKEKLFIEQDKLRGTRGIDKYGRGEKGMEEFGGLAGLVAAMETLVEVAKPEKMEEAVSKAAKNLEAPAGLFKEGANKFDGAVDKFIRHLKDMGVSVEAPGSNADKVVYHKGVPYPAGGSRKKK